MKLTCSQMDVLISFYIENELSSSLKKQVEEHLFECSTCMAKYEIVKSMINDMKNSYAESASFTKTDSSSSANSEQYRVFKTNLSAYIDNELPNNDVIKMKKFTINNKRARKDLEDSYNIRRLMNDSFKKTKAETKKDYSKSVLKQLELEKEVFSGFHPAINLLIIFTLSVLVIATFVLISLNL